MRPSIRLYLAIAAVLLSTGLVLRLAKEQAQHDPEYARVSEVISQEGFERLRPVHRRMLAHIVEQHVRSKTPVVAACWDAAAGDQEAIDAFNAAITLGQSAGTEFQQTSRWSSTALSGGGLGQGQVTTITYSFVPDGTSIPSGTGEPAGNSNMFAWLNGIYGNAATWQQIFAEEFARWSDFTGVNYVYEPNDDGVTMFNSSGSSGVRGDVRIGAKTIDGNSSVLAYNFFPNNGDMVLDSADNFYNTTSNNSRRLRNIISHEHGHGLGMLHVCPVNGTKLMEPFINTSFLGPQLDDVLNGQRHYGDDYEPNDSVAAASDLGTLSNGVSTFTDMSTDDNSDTDVYKFTTLQAQTLGVTLRPVGATYTEGPQTSQCNTGSTFDSLTVSNLTLEVIDLDGTTVLGSANINPAGQNEVLSGILLPNSGDYFIRVTPDSTNSVQRYELDIDLSIFVPINFAIQFPDGRPDTLDSNYLNPIRIETIDFSGTPDPANSFAYFRIDGSPWIQTPMVDLGSNIWWAQIPAGDCFTKVDYYIEMFPIGGGPAERSPSSAPSLFYSADSLQQNAVTVLDDDFEADLGWTVLSEPGVTGGAWERGVPSGDGTRGDPVNDADGSGSCYLTENGAGNTDVDGGRTRLFSPILDLSGFNEARLRYSFWFSNDAGNNPNEDPFDVHVRESATAPWVLVESYNANANSWLDREVMLTDYINLTATVQVRFRALDLGVGGSIVEAGVDSVEVVGCPSANPIGPWAAGAVGVLDGPPVSVLLINSLDGGDNREVNIPVNNPYVSAIDNPPGYANAGYALFARLGRPSPNEVYKISDRAGYMCFLPAPLDPLNGGLFTVAWTYPGPPAGVLDPFATVTPWVIVNSGFPFPFTVSLQAVISEGPALRVTNMVILNIQ